MILHLECRNEKQFRFDIIPASSTSYVYSTTTGSRGLLQSVTRDQITETYAYDALCRLTTTTTSTSDLWPDGTQLPATTQTYNPRGQMASTTYPSGLTVQYVKDAVGNLTRINDASRNKIWSGDAIDAV